MLFFDGEYRDLETTFFSFFIFAKMRSVVTKVTARHTHTYIQTHTETDKAMAVNEIEYLPENAGKQEEKNKLKENMYERANRMKERRKERTNKRTNKRTNERTKQERKNERINNYLSEHNILNK